MVQIDVSYHCHTSPHTLQCICQFWGSSWPHSDELWKEFEKNYSSGVFRYIFLVILEWVIRLIFHCYFDSMMSNVLSTRGIRTRRPSWFMKWNTNTYESVASRLASLSVCYHNGLFDFTIDLKMFTEGLVCCVVGKPSHEELGPGRVLLAGVVDHGGGRGGRGGRG